MATCSRVSATTSAPVTPTSASAAVRSASETWMTIWPRSMSWSKTSSGGSTVAHAQAEVGIVGIGEAVDALHGEHRAGVRPGEGVVENATATDGGELVPVTEERDPGARFVGEGQQRQGVVLGDHARL